jgi:hypothetical protein
MNWDEVRPVLEAAYRLMDQDDEGSTWPDAVSAELGKPQDSRIVRILGQLYEAGYITGRPSNRAPRPSPLRRRRRACSWSRGGRRQTVEAVRLSSSLASSKRRGVTQQRALAIKEAMVASAAREIALSGHSSFMLDNDLYGKRIRFT